MRATPSAFEHRAIVAVGSNLGDSVGTIARAVTLLELLLKSPVARSPLYETRPMYEEAQPRFVNGVLVVDTVFGPFELLALLLEIEARFGRVRDADARFGARTIDLDLVAMDGVEMHTAALTLPHPRCHERGFVLRPLVDILPGWVHPQLCQSAASLLRDVDSSSTADASWTLIESPVWHVTSPSLPPSLAR